ncbi:CUGBP Elav-like member 5 [Perkinsus olseni]|uniref:CUGBP Elav-like member 5 n=1 Tax=Perkinsus olseni TaxID=32597 RepID=A0A7J6LDX9_PEROL|nr:CUGBP Elav-like member 5 [Perkinsus olseni]KAF4657321.1 CUGBP Elav-like member 5 [Perkinsus olseni]
MRGRVIGQATLAAAASAGAIYYLDENYCYCVGRRTFRAAKCGAFIWWQYKRVWNADNASEVHRRVAEEIVATCKRNEGLYVKIGQVLCSMEVALPKEMHKPFEELHDRALEMEESEVLRLLRESGVDEVIQDFELEPVASASIAQVHKARLKASPHTSVAVKLRKPSVTFQVAWDLRAYWLILWALERSFDIPMLWTYGFTREQFRQEMDLRNEAANSNRAKAEFEQSDLKEFVYVPDVFWASEEVIVAEWIDEAVKVTDAAILGVDLGQTVRHCTEMFAHQIFNTGHVIEVEWAIR